MATIVVKQREYIENFLDFVGSFCTFEQVTLNEMLLVEANVKCLLERIRRIKEATTIPPLFKKDNPEYEAALQDLAKGIASGKLKPITPNLD